MNRMTLAKITPYVEEAIRELPGLEVSIAFIDLTTKNRWFECPDRDFHAASTMKVAVMTEVFRQAEAGALALDREVEIRNQFVSVADGSSFSVTAEDDSDSELFECIGGKVPVRELVRRMIVKSSNLATNELLRLVGASKTQDFMLALGLPGIQVIRGVEDKLAYRSGLNNTVTARDLSGLFALLADGQVVSPDASNQMIEILLGQEHNEGIPAGLRDASRVAHKTGWIDKIYHDAGIVYPESGAPFVWVVLTSGFADLNSGGSFVAGLTRSLTDD